MAVAQRRESRCPICTGERLPRDASLAKQGTFTVLRGRVNAVVHPEEASYTPFGNYCTVPLYPRKGRVKYLKFRTSHELDRWGMKRDDRIEAKGCLHDVDGKELIFDVRDILST